MEEVCASAVTKAHFGNDHTHLWHTEQDSIQRCGVHMRASGIKTTLSSNVDREQSWSGGAVSVGTGRDEVGWGSAINSRQGGVFKDSWKALGCRTGTCQMQLLLWLIDRVCIPP